MQQSLMQQGVELMLYGMGTVFVFLTLLVIFTAVMSAFLSRFMKPESMAETPAISTPHAAHDSHLIAAITAAVHKHRSRHK